MPVTDRREPAVYVDIQDVSYAAPTLETGRTVYNVILCDRGPHNRIVPTTTRDQYYTLFGKPDYRRSSLAHYLGDKALQYTSKLLTVRVMPDDAYWSNETIQASNAGTLITYGSGTDAQFTFTPGLNTIVCANQSSFDVISVGEWIYANGDNVAVSAQIVSTTTTTLTLNLDRNYEGSISGVQNGYSCTPYINNTVSHVTSELDMPTTNSNVVWYFYGKGSGSYYNNIIVSGVRNVAFEKMYTDSDGNVLYPYLFMDIGVYYLNSDGTQTKMEGPWTVSLTRKIATGSTVKDLSSGQGLYIEDIINRNSDFISCISAQGVNGLVATGVTNEAQATKRRLQTMLLLTVSGATLSTSGNIAAGGIQFENGTDGTVDTDRTLPMYNTSNDLESTRDRLDGCVAQAYEGTLTSVDGSIEQIPECVYPWYSLDYVVSGGYSSAIQNSARALADYRQDCIHLADTGAYYTSVSQDLTARQSYVPWNNWTSMLYVQYRKLFDIFTGENIWMTPVYHALERHLVIDGTYFLAEPVAGIEKGAISDAITLAYRANHTERGDLQDQQLNMIIVEPQGTYILTQLTTWKRMSVLSRGHVAKFTAYVRKVVPTLLKDILQRKATAYWIGQSQFRVTNFLGSFLESGNERYSVLKSFNVSVTFDDVRSELNVMIDMTPIRAIERINVFITLH